MLPDRRATPWVLATLAGTALVAAAQEHTLLASISTTLALAVLAAWGAQVPLDAIRERRRVDKEARSKELFELFAELFNMELSDGEHGRPDAEVKGRYGKLREQLLLHGDADVITAYNRWQSIGWLETAQRDGGAAYLQMEQLVRALRASIGHDDRRVAEGNLLSLILTPKAKEEMRRRTILIQRSVRRRKMKRGARWVVLICAGLVTWWLVGWPTMDTLNEILGAMTNGESP